MNQQKLKPILQEDYNQSLLLPCLQEVRISDHLSQYYRLLQIDPQKGIDMHHVVSQLKKKPYNSFKVDLQIKVKHHSINYEILTLDVEYGHFNKVINILNINKMSPTYNLSCIGRGSHGQIFNYKNENQNMAIKCLNFNDNNFKSRLQQAVKQYTTLLIAEQFKIGPQIVKRHGFDLVIYHQSIQFCMQMCKMQYQIDSQFINKLKNKLYRLHLLNIVHLDVKPSNIGWSQLSNSFVFIDFGIRYKSRTHFAGTYDYCSQEMQKLLISQQSGLVDLYYNDAVGLNQSISIIEIYKKYQPQQQQIAIIDNQIINFHNDNKDDDDLYQQIIEAFFNYQNIKNQKDIDLLLHIKFLLYSIAFNLVNYYQNKLKVLQSYIKKYSRQIKSIINNLPFGPFYAYIFSMINSGNVLNHNIEYQQKVSKKHYHESLEQNHTFIFRYNLLNNYQLKLSDDFLLDNILSFNKKVLVNKNIIKNIPQSQYYLKVIQFIKINGLADIFSQVLDVCRNFYESIYKYPLHKKIEFYQICLMQIMFYGFEDKNRINGCNILKQTLQTLIITQILSQSQFEELYLTILNKTQDFFMKMILLFQIIISLQFISYKFISRYNYKKMKLFCFSKLKNYLDTVLYREQQQQMMKDTINLISLIIEQNKNMSTLYKNIYDKKNISYKLLHHQRQFIQKTLYVYTIYTSCKIKFLNRQELTSASYSVLNMLFEQEIFNDRFCYYFSHIYYQFYILMKYQTCSQIHKTFVKRFGHLSSYQHFQIHLLHNLMQIGYYQFENQNTQNSNANKVIQNSNLLKYQYKYIYGSFVRIIDEGMHIHDYLLHLMSATNLVLIQKNRAFINSILLYNKSKIIKIRFQEDDAHDDKLHVNPLKLPIKAILTILGYGHYYKIYDKSQIDQYFNNFIQSVQQCLSKIFCNDCKVYSLINYRIYLVKYYELTLQFERAIEILIELLIFSFKEHQFNKFIYYCLQNLIQISYRYNIPVSQMGISQLIYDYFISTQHCLEVFNTKSTNYSLLVIYRLVDPICSNSTWAKFISQSFFLLCNFRSVHLNQKFLHSTKAIIQCYLQQEEYLVYHQKVIQLLLITNRPISNAYLSLYLLPFIEVNFNKSLIARMMKYIASSIDIIDINAKNIILSKYYQAYLKIFPVNRRKKMIIIKKTLVYNGWPQENTYHVKDFINKSKIRTVKSNIKYSCLVSKVKNLLGQL